MPRIRLFPLFSELPKREINKVILHCSASPFGDRKLLWKWHVQENGWSDIGYHFVIGNTRPDNYPENKGIFNLAHDGKILRCRPVEKQGAHCQGENEDSIGICLIGNKLFSARQFYSLIVLMDEIKYVYPKIKLFGHYETKSGSDQGKTCPNLNMDWVRKITGVSNEKT